MPMLKRCCFSRNLRCGTIVCGAWSLVGTVFSMGVTINDLDNTYNNPDYFVHNYDNPTGLIVMSWINLVVTFLTTLSSILLIVAVLKNKAMLMVPWMVLLAILILLDAAHIIFNILLDGFSNILIAILLAWIIFTLLNIYCELCVLSHYQEVKLGRGHRDDYMGRHSVRYASEVQHVHITDAPMQSYVQSQHTVYSFHSQSLYDDEGKGSLKVPPTAPNGMPKTVLSNVNGRVLELRPVASVPSDMDTRLKGNCYTGSIEMKVVDSIPVTFDRIDNYTGSLDMTPVSGKRPRRFRTVSESAVVKQQKLDESRADGAASSLRNIAEKECGEGETNHQPLPARADVSGDGSGPSSNSDIETLPLTSNLELQE